MQFIVPKSRSGMVLRGLILLAGLLATAGCITSPSVVSPADTTPANLDVNLTISPNPASPSFVTISALFVYQDVPVHFTHGETITCNGVPLTFQPNLYLSDQIPARKPNTPYTCIYSRDGAHTEFVFEAIPAPVFTTPKDGDTVARQSNFTITYTPFGNGATIQADADNGPHTNERGGQQPDTGRFTGLNTLALRPGSGTITLTRSTTLTLYTAFHSAKVQGSATTRIDVIWT